MAKDWKASEVWDMVQNVCEKTAKNIDFVENRIPLEEIWKLFFADILAKIDRKIAVAESYYINFARLKPVTLLQQSSATSVSLWHSIFTECVVRIFGKS